jgi:hypothetical protein
MKQKKVTRREALGVLGAAGAMLSLGCGSETPTGPSAVTTTGITEATGVGSAACAVTPSEKAGPYPPTDMIRGDIRFR